MPFREKSILDSVVLDLSNKKTTFNSAIIPILDV
jgi:hypothetical protein